MIENLGLWAPHSDTLDIRTLSSMPLRKLSIRLDSLFGRSRPDFRQHPFQHLTHFEILDRQETWAYIEEVSLLESLTHIAFNECSEDTTEGALRHCQRLRVLILLDEDSEDWIDTLPESEVRVVTPPEDLTGSEWRDDWDAGTMGGNDFWARAEAVVAQRLKLVQENYAVGRDYDG